MANATINSKLYPTPMATTVYSIPKGPALVSRNVVHMKLKYDNLWLPDSPDASVTRDGCGPVTKSGTVEHGSIMNTRKSAKF